MAKIPEIIPSSFPAGCGRGVRHIRSRKQPLIVTQRGRAAAVLLSMEAYERSEQERQLLRIT